VWIAVLGSVMLFPNLEAALNGVFNRVLTTLRLDKNKIGPEGAIAIAEALKVNADRGLDRTLDPVPHGQQHRG
jgi:hypothetical protein